MKKTKIETPLPQDYNELLKVWEASVRSTHHFLTEEDILFYKLTGDAAFKSGISLYMLRNEQARIVAFMGLSAHLTEMLFVHPDAQGKGYGTQLLEFALHEKHVYKVDVNEQNKAAFQFYLHRGFRVIGRSTTDSSGNPFPILHLEYAPKLTVKVYPPHEDKTQFLDLLLLGDAQESMINRYLERGKLFALYDEDELKSLCVVTEEQYGIYEIKNMATYPHAQRKGYGLHLIFYLIDYYKDLCNNLWVGTGESPLTLSFYEKCGFTFSYRILNFFTTNYDHPIYEGGKQLIDMIYLKKEIHDTPQKGVRPLAD